jgi:hypothetical protein
MQFFLVCHPRTTASQGYSQERCPVKSKEKKLSIAEPDTGNRHKSRPGTIANLGWQRHEGESLKRFSEHVIPNEARCLRPGPAGARYPPSIAVNRHDGFLVASFLGMNSTPFAGIRIKTNRCDTPPTSSKLPVEVLLPFPTRMATRYPPPNPIPSKWSRRPFAAYIHSSPNQQAICRAAPE